MFRSTLMLLSTTVFPSVLLLFDLFNSITSLCFIPSISYLPYNEIDVVSKLALFNPIPNSKAIGKASSAKSFVVPYSCILS